MNTRYIVGSDLGTTASTSVALMYPSTTSRRATMPFNFSRATQERGSDGASGADE